MNPFDIFDRYVLFARLGPALIATGPVILLFLLVFPRLSFARILGSAAIVVIFLYIMADIAARQGGAIEGDLIQRMGGLPSTVMLRHSDNTIDPITKARAHEFLAQQVKQPAPTPVDEANDPAKADHFYTACGNWLRENTRDHDKFNILFDENISYGFHRNLLGLRTIAFVLDGLVIAICVVWLWFRRPFSVNDRLTLTLSAIICVTAVQAVYLGLWIAPQGAIDAAHRYGRQLILSFEKF